MKLTPEQIAEIEKRTNAAEASRLENEVIRRYEQGGGRIWDEQPGTEGRNLIADFYEEPTREFYIYARADIPALLAHIRALQDERDAAVKCCDAWLHLENCRAKDKGKPGMSIETSAAHHHLYLARAALKSAGAEP